MNRISRLTALLLALMMIFSTLAVADTGYQLGEMTQDQWNQIVTGVQEIAETPVIDVGGEVVAPVIPEWAPVGDAPEGKQYTSITEADLSAGSVEATLYTSGQLIVKGTSEGQWQINVGGNAWVNIAGEVGSTLTVTCAMVEALGSKVEVRQADNSDSVATISIVDYQNTMLMVAAVRGAEDAGQEVAPVGYDDVMTIEDANKHTVIINYLFAADESMAASAYMASLGKGTPFNVEIKIPVVPGYYAEVDTLPDGFTFDSVENTISIALEAVEQDWTVNVWYQPGLVEYTVIHYLQNVDDDNYYIERLTTKEGTTGTQVPAEDVALTFDGFYNLLYEQPEIAADGSTVVEIYYDRYYYLMNFELVGGYGVEPIYGRYGMDIPAVGTPVRAGYEFLGWSEGIPATMPARHTVFTARWNPLANSFTVVYWLENADDDNYSFWGSRKVAAMSGDTIADGAVYQDYTEIAYSLNAYERRYSSFASADQNVVVKGDGSTVVNVYYDRNEYTLKFYYAYTDIEGAGNGNHYVVGGTSYYFGHWAETKLNISDKGVLSNALALLNLYNTNGTAAEHKGQVTAVPGLNAAGMSRGYNSGSDTYDGYRYYYISFNAKYGADISEMWPGNVFESVERSEPNPDSKNWDSRTAYVSAWNGENHVYYTQKNSNETIKGNYNKLDYQLLWDYDLFGDSATVDYLCFWENGATISWSIPELYRYFIYVPVLQGQDTTGLQVREYNGVRYYVRNIYDTIDNSNPREQTAPAIDGFNCINADGSKWTPGITNNTENDYGIGYEAPYWKRINIPNEYYQDGKATVSRAYEIYFFYTRNSYDLTFVNVGDTISTETIPFETDISNRNFVPPYPEDYEKDAYRFDGWYTTAEFFEGTEFSFDNATMPSNHVTLHARWVPVTHTVKFYFTEQTMNQSLDYVYYPDAENDVAPAVFENVPHGTQIAQEYVDKYLDRDSMMAANYPYTFESWFYYDENNEKKAFEPTTPIMQDLYVFAEWSSNVLVPYTIHYKVGELINGEYVAKKDDAGKDIVVADPTRGYALAGVSRTFEAKGDTELYVDFQSGYFPVIPSHTVTFLAEQGNAGFEYIFWYTDPRVVPYTVYYVSETPNDSGLGSVSLDGKTYYPLLKEVTVADNTKAVVTENFVVVPGYMPDAYQKRLVVSTDGDNKIIFVYTKDDKHAYYQVTHYIETLTPNRWTEYTSNQLPGEIGKTDYVDDPLTISGFTYDESLDEYLVGGSKYSGSPDGVYELTAEGLQINLYYQRNEYPYVVNYLEQGTNKVLADPKDGMDLYGQTVREEAKEIVGYTCVTASPQNIQIRVETQKVDEDGQPVVDEAGNPVYEVLWNIITFYYTEDQKTINYVPVGPEGLNEDGTPKETVAGSVTLGSETVKVLTDAAQGSSAVANTPTYKFVGWYSEPECIHLLTEDMFYVPQKVDHDNDDSTAAMYVEATYYAKFELNVADLTITKTVDGAENPPDEDFELTVELKDVSGQKVTGTYDYTRIHGATETTGTLEVTNGTGTLNIKAGETISIQGIVIGSTYTVTEVNVPAYFDASYAGGKQSGEMDANGEMIGITNTYLTGNLTISKKVEDATAPETDEFIFTVTLPAGTFKYVQNGEEKSITSGNTVILKANESVTITGIPAGADYTVIERPDDRYDTTSTGATGTIVADQTQTAEFTNSYKLGDLRIGKRVEGEAPADAKFDFTLTLTDANDAALTGSFDAYIEYLVSSKTVNGETVEVYERVQGTDRVITLTGDTASVYSFQLTKGQHLVIKDLPDGTKYTVKETPVQGYTTFVSINNKVPETGGKTTTSSGAIIAGREQKIRFINAFYKGTLDVVKRVAGAAAPKGEKFDFIITLMDANGELLGGVYPYTITHFDTNGNRVETRGATESTIEVKLGDLESVLITNLPDNAKFAVSEVLRAPDYTTDAKVNENSTEQEIASTLMLSDLEMHRIEGIVGTDHMAQVVFTNTYQYGDLTIKKTVDGAGNAGDIFLFDVTGPNNYSTTVMLTAGQSITLTKLPFGEYTVEEDTAWSWRYITGTASKTVTIDATQNGYVEITNKLDNQKWLDDETYVKNIFDGTN